MTDKASPLVRLCSKKKIKVEAVTFSLSEAVSTESSVRLSAEDDDSSESSSAGWGSTGQSVGKPKSRKDLAHS